MGLNLSKIMAYKFNFFLQSLGWLSFDLIGPLFAFLIYTHTAGFPGWTLWEFLLFNGIMVAVFAISAFALTGIVDRVADSVEDGTIDKYKIRPLNTLLLCTVRSGSINAVPTVIAGITLTIVAAIKLNLPLQLNIIVFALTVLFALIFMYSLAIMVAAVAFLAVKSQGLWQIIYAAEQYAKYPIDIYPRKLAFIFTFLLPIGLAGFYPAQAILGRLDWSLIPWLALTTFSFLTVAILLWSWALKRYTSAGG